jgi:hypothetical protein
VNCRFCVQSSLYLFFVSQESLPLNSLYSNTWFGSLFYEYSIYLRSYYVLQPTLCSIKGGKCLDRLSRYQQDPATWSQVLIISLTILETFYACAAACFLVSLFLSTQATFPLSESICCDATSCLCLCEHFYRNLLKMPSILL